MKLIRLEINESFRSLQNGFKINFRNTEDRFELFEFRPFCFVGLNGSGKSNVLEALASIFFHLERCYRNFQPNTFKKDFKKEKCSPDAFELEYIINTNTKDLDFISIDKIDTHTLFRYIVKVAKQKGEEPQVFIKKNNNTGDYREIFSSVNEYLPEYIVGYSSGENEILSLPFFKTRFIHFDEYIEHLKEGLPFSEPESSMVYIDATMSQSVLLANYLMQDKQILSPFKEKLDIEDIYQFRIVLNYNKKLIELEEEGERGIVSEDRYDEIIYKEKVAYTDILYSVGDIIFALKKCATCWYYDNDTNELILDYKIDIIEESEVKAAFQIHFNDNVFDLFSALRTLQTLNFYSIEDKENLYKSESLYINEEIPINPIKKRVFRIENFKIKKTNIDYPIDTKNLSDGEHQFLHTMGISIMAKDKNALFLLDEPETHFNPDWRSHFMSTMKNCLEVDGSNHLLNDLIITTHSPFIVSDTYQKYVRIFKQNEGCKIPEIETFGASSNLLLKKIFGRKKMISELSLDLMSTIEKRLMQEEIDFEELIELSEILGDSPDKLMLLDYIYRIKDSKENK